MCQIGKDTSTKPFPRQTYLFNYSSDSFLSNANLFNLSISNDFSYFLYLIRRNWNSIYIPLKICYKEGNKYTFQIEWIAWKNTSNGMLMVINGSKWTYIFNYPFTLFCFSPRLYWIAIIYHHFLGWVPISSLLFSIYFIVRISHKSSPCDSTLDWIMNYNIFISYYAINQQDR